MSNTHKHHVTQAQAHTLHAWELFLDQHGGCYPSSIAAIKLRMTPQGVYQASQRGWIAFFLIGRDRWYSRKDVVNYRWHASRRFADNRPRPLYEGVQNDAVTT
jgi:hypothetical protein